MPTYDYRCKKCGKTFEKFQSMTEPALKKCPRSKCGGTVERLIGGGAGFIFKGTGFYQTDYKRQKAEGGGQKAEEGRGKKEEGRRTKDEGRNTKDEGRGTKDEGSKKESAPKPEKKADKKE